MITSYSTRLNSFSSERFELRDDNKRYYNALSVTEWKISNSVNSISVALSESNSVRYEIVENPSYPMFENDFREKQSPMNEADSLNFNFSVERILLTFF